MLPWNSRHRAPLRLDNKRGTTATRARSEPAHNRPPVCRETDRTERSSGRKRPRKPVVARPDSHKPLSNYGTERVAEAPCPETAASSPLRTKDRRGEPVRALVVERSSSTSARSQHRQFIMSGRGVQPIPSAAKRNSKLAKPREFASLSRRQSRARLAQW